MYWDQEKKKKKTKESCLAWQNAQYPNWFRSGVEAVTHLHSIIPACDVYIIHASRQSEWNGKDEERMRDQMAASVDISTRPRADR